jgi:hypothetical protein
VLQKLFIVKWWDDINAGNEERLARCSLNLCEGMKDIGKAMNVDLLILDRSAFSTFFFEDQRDRGLLSKSPDGHLKIPHLWPGQNPPATVEE